MKPWSMKQDHNRRLTDNMIRDHMKRLFIRVTKTLNKKGKFLRLNLKSLEACFNRIAKSIKLKRPNFAISSFKKAKSL